MSRTLILLGTVAVTALGCGPPPGPVTAAEANPPSFTQNGYSGQSGIGGPGGGGGSSTSTMVVVPVRVK